MAWWASRLRSRLCRRVAIAAHGLAVSVAATLVCGCGPETQARRGPDPAEATRAWYAAVDRGDMERVAVSWVGVDVRARARDDLATYRGAPLLLGAVTLSDGDRSAAVQVKTGRGDHRLLCWHRAGDTWRLESAPSLDPALFLEPAVTDPAVCWPSDDAVADDPAGVVFRLAARLRQASPLGLEERGRFYVAPTDSSAPLVSAWQLGLAIAFPVVESLSVVGPPKSRAAEGVAAGASLEWTEDGGRWRIASVRRWVPDRGLNDRERAELATLLEEVGAAVTRRDAAAYAARATDLAAPTPVPLPRERAELVVRSLAVPPGRHLAPARDPAAQPAVRHSVRARLEPVGPSVGPGVPAVDVVAALTSVGWRVLSLHEAGRSLRIDFPRPMSAEDLDRALAPSSPGGANGEARPPTVR